MGGKYAQNSSAHLNGGRKKEGRTDPQMWREKFSDIFEGVGKLTFPTPSYTLVHVCAKTLVTLNTFLASL